VSVLHGGPRTALLIVDVNSGVCTAWWSSDSFII